MSDQGCCLRALAMGHRPSLPENVEGPRIIVSEPIPLGQWVRADIFSDRIEITPENVGGPTS